MRRVLMDFIVMSVTAPTIAAQQLMIYPANGQSADQQAKDHAECNAWATQQTGFDMAVGVPMNSGSGLSGWGEIVGERSPMTLSATACRRLEDSMAGAGEDSWLRLAIRPAPPVLEDDDEKKRPW